MATHSSTLAWKIPWAEEPGGIQSMGLWGFEHDWESTSRALWGLDSYNAQVQPKRGLLWGWALQGCCHGNSLLLVVFFQILGERPAAMQSIVTTTIYAAIYIYIYNCNIYCNYIYIAIYIYINNIYIYCFFLLEYVSFRVFWLVRTGFRVFLLLLLVSFLVFFLLCLHSLAFPGNHLHCSTLGDRWDKIFKNQKIGNPQECIIKWFFGSQGSHLVWLLSAFQFYLCFVYHVQGS